MRKNRTSVVEQLYRAYFELIVATFCYTTAILSHPQPSTAMVSLVYSLGKRTPMIPSSAWIAPGARVSGDVRLGQEVGVWFNCVLRGDDSSIQVGDRSNIQDLTMIHLDTGCPCIIGKEVTVGHSCILHGCTVEDEVRKIAETRLSQPIHLHKHTYNYTQKIET